MHWELGLPMTHWERGLPQLPMMHWERDPSDNHDALGARTVQCPWCTESEDYPVPMMHWERGVPMMHWEQGLPMMHRERAPLRTWLQVDGELAATSLIHDRVDRVEESLVLVQVDGRDRQYGRAHGRVLPHVYTVRGLAEQGPVVIDVQHGHVYLDTSNVTYSVQHSSVPMSSTSLQTVKNCIKNITFCAMKTFHLGQQNLQYYIVPFLSFINEKSRNKWSGFILCSKFELKKTAINHFSTTGTWIRQAARAAIVTSRFKIFLTQTSPLCGATCYKLSSRTMTRLFNGVNSVYRSVKVYRTFCSYLRVLVRIRNFYNGGRY